MSQRIGDILDLPDTIEAVVFDVDGVLLDTVGVDHDIVTRAASAVWGEASWLTVEAVRTHFALEAESFLAELVKAAPFSVTDAEITEAVTAYQQGRRDAVFAPIPGALDVIAGCQEAQLKVAIGSSNDQDVLETMLDRSGVKHRFSVISGIRAGVRAKPAPDIYAKAAQDLGVAPERCAFIEDSITGLTSGRAAGFGHAIAVATGATPLTTLRESGLADAAFDRFAAPQIAFIPGAPMEKTIDTPDDFVSHMVEHIAWRLGVGITLHWREADWAKLGAYVGDALKTLAFRNAAAATLGMIDDGAAETLIDFTAPPAADFQCHPSLDRDLILGLRVEQVGAGRELTDLLEGLAQGLGARIETRMCTFEDPHHSWEGVYRSVGICLDRLRAA